MQLDLVLQVLHCSDKTFMSQKGWIPKLSWKEAFQANKKVLESDIMFILCIQVWNRKQKVKKRPSGTFHHHGQQRICHWTTWTPSARVSLIAVVHTVKGRFASEANLFWRGWISDGGHAESVGTKGRGQRAKGKGPAKPLITLRWRKTAFGRMQLLCNSNMDFEKEFSN